jgi:hypothetical protein
MCSDVENPIAAFNDLFRLGIHLLVEFLGHDLFEERCAFLALSAHWDVRCKEVVLPDRWQRTLSARMDPLRYDVFSRISRLVINDLGSLPRIDVFHMFGMW